MTYVSARWLAASSSVLLACALLEIALRVVYGHPPHWRYPQASHVLTEHGYHKLAPNQTHSFTLDQPVGTNAAGFRDVEWDVRKPDGRTRIMVLGDSLTFGTGVRGDATYPKILERELRRNGTDVEVLSASVQGWDTWHELQFFKTEGRFYRPDLVVLGFYMNDFRKGPLTPPPMTREGVFDNRPPWLLWLSYEYVFLFKRSALLTYVRDRIGMLAGGPDDRATLLLRNRIDPRSDEDITSTWSYIADLRRLSEMSDAPLILASIPSINLFWFPRQPVGYVQYLEERSRADGIRFIDLAQGFWTEPDTNRLYLYPWNLHLSAAGHEVVARQLTQEVKKQLGDKKWASMCEEPCTSDHIAPNGRPRR